MLSNKNSIPDGASWQIYGGYVDEDIKPFQDAEVERLKTENDILKENLQRIKKDNRLKDHLYKNIKSLVTCLIKGISTIVILSILEIPRLLNCGEKCLINVDPDNSLLITLVSSTTATIIGLYMVVAKHLFPQNKE